MTKISAKIVADSISEKGHRITTMELVFPRFLLAELNTHRVFSKNSASSRAIPFKKMVEMVQNDPFIPIAWQKDHKGMQGTEYITDEKAIQNLNNQWLKGRDGAINVAQSLNKGAYTLEVTKDENGNNMRGVNLTDIPDTSVTKQLCNRLFEPFMWHKVLLTSTEFKNFFELRCGVYDFSHVNDSTYKSKKDVLKYVGHNEYIPEFGKILNEFTKLDWLKINKGEAEIHMMELAECMYDALKESNPEKLKVGEWHIPYEELLMAQTSSMLIPHKSMIKASTGLCARTSYLTVGDDKTPNLETLIGIHDKMVNAVPFHASPFEHCATVPTDEEYENSIGKFRNYRGFIQYRQILESK